MAMGVGGAGGGPQASMNMTPLIDVLLVLIIIFMVITPLTPKGLDALAPQPPPPNQQSQPDNRTVVVTVEKGPSYKINNEITNEKDMGDRLFEIFKTRADKVVFVKGDPDLDYRYIATAIDIAHGAGVDKVGLMTPKLEAGQ